MFENNTTTIGILARAATMDKTEDGVEQMNKTDWMLAEDPMLHDPAEYQDHQRDTDTSHNVDIKRGKM